MKINFNFFALLLCPLTVLFSGNVYGDDQSPLNCNASSYELRMLDESEVLYLSVNNFCADFTKSLGNSLRDFFKKHSSQTMKGTVLDLRQTGSIGMNHTVAGLASVFMYPGTLLGTFQDAKGIYYPIKTGKAYYQITNEADYLRDLPEFLTEAPIAVLVSQQTKGAPEILAFNLLDGRNAILLGEEFEESVGNSIDLHNPFYHLIAPILSIAPIEAEQSQPQSKRYIYQETQIGGKDNCTEEQYSYLTNKSSEALVKVVKYPRSAQIKEIEGAGSLAAQVDKTGKLVSQWILISTGDDALDYAMLEAGQKAKFPSSECISETATYRIPIVFLLTN